ncbi:alpha/beta hydrolase [Algivirga pacifica]|uniref:AB hydrolase-1 domain-containing protein n=1 Tax=Algivirga pacifica TaxID=1162670 RepID=A0ABP9D5J6_9BACT
MIETKRYFDIRQVENAEVTTYTLMTIDDVELTLTRVQRSSDTDAVLMLHGLSSSSKMFTGREWYNLTCYMIDHGIGDVWLLDWRGSAEYGTKYVHREDSADDVAFKDIPLAVEFIQQQIENGLHIIGHCIGAMTLSMALAKGTIQHVKSAIITSIGLFPKLNNLTTAKLYAVPQLAEKLLDIDYFSMNADQVNPQDGQFMIHQLANLGSNECEHPTCKMLSFVWGTGHESTIFKHKHLPKETHERLEEYFGAVSSSYFRHFQKMLQHQAVVNTDASENYLDQVENIKTPMLLMTGKDNRCWHDAIQEYAKLLDRFFPSVNYEKFVIPDYSHNDVFMGKNAYLDVFPEVLAFIKKYS